MDVINPTGLSSDIVAAGGFEVPDRASPTTIVTAIEEQCGDALFGFACRLGLDDPTAEDIVQEGLLRLFDALEAGQGIRDHRAWTFTVVYRLAMDQHRLRERARRHDPVAAEHGPEPTGNDPVTLVERKLVWHEVDQLPERQRLVLYLRYRADLPFEAVGQALGITASAARSHATQAVATLRVRLARDGAG